MSVRDCKKILGEGNENIAFVVGNGINRYFNPLAASWDDLILKLWRRHSYRTKSSVPRGISFTEFYDALELENFGKPGFAALLQKDVVKEMEGWKASDEQNNLLRRIRDLDAPLLTLNIDDLIPQTLGLTVFRRKNYKSNDFYPWNVYFGDRELTSPLGGFAVWYVNGMVKYHRSIKLGLSHYMGNVATARPMLLSAGGKKKLFNRPKSSVYNSWLNVLFSKELFIFGLGLEENETFLRWLLIQRAKYIRITRSPNNRGWFVMSDEGKSSTDGGKRFFLESVGIEVLTVPTYQDLYQSIWS